MWNVPNEDGEIEMSKIIEYAKSLGFEWDADTKLGDANKIEEIINILPYSKTVSNITIVDDGEGKLNIFFDELQKVWENHF